jgi:RimJ/RimL family protein N-acetyltransferase
MIHAMLDTPRGPAALRDLAADDLDHVVAYLHDERDTHLSSLIDRTRLGTPEATRQRFLRALRTGDAAQQTIAFAITAGGRFAGFTMLNRYTAVDNYSHWHVTEPALRASGLSTALYPHRIKLYFDLFPIDRLVHQTKTRNTGVNRMLDKYVPVAETRYVERPDGAASPDTFHLRHVFRADVARFFAIAARLARQPERTER